MDSGLRIRQPFSESDSSRLADGAQLRGNPRRRPRLVLEDLLHQAVKIMQAGRALDGADDPRIIALSPLLSGQEHDRDARLSGRGVRYLVQAPFVDEQELGAQARVLLLQRPQGLGKHQLIAETSQDHVRLRAEGLPRGVIDDRSIPAGSVGYRIGIGFEHAA